jgi:hypothetical protein
VTNAGGTIVSPISGGAYLVRLGPDAMGKLREAGGAPWIEPWAPAFKLSRELDLSAPGPVDVTALLFSDGDGDATVTALRALGAANLASHRGSLSHLVRFELDRSRLAEAAALADVAWIEPTPVYSFNNDKAQWVLQSGVPNARPVSDHGLRGQGQVVMTSDSGIRTNHEMFNDSTQAINGWGDYPTHRKIIAYQPGSDSPFITFGDDVSFDYHGTHTGGTVGGNPDPTSTGRGRGWRRTPGCTSWTSPASVTTGFTRPPTSTTSTSRPTSGTRAVRRASRPTRGAVVGSAPTTRLPPCRPTSLFGTTPTT